MSLNRVFFTIWDSVEKWRILTSSNFRKALFYAAFQHLNFIRTYRQITVWPQLVHFIFQPKLLSILSTLCSIKTRMILQNVSWWFIVGMESWKWPRIDVDGWTYPSIRFRSLLKSRCLPFVSRNVHSNKKVPILLIKHQYLNIIPYLT